MAKRGIVVVLDREFLVWFTRNLEWSKNYTSTSTSRLPNESRYVKRISFRQTSLISSSESRFDKRDLFRFLDKRVSLKIICRVTHKSWRLKIEWFPRNREWSDFNYYPILLCQSFDNKNFNLSEKKLLLSGDIECNPGPVIIHNLLNTRLRRHRLTPLDVGCSGDCFFKSVSHQLYGDSSHHLAIRATSVEYLRTNPERFNI